MSNEVTEKDEGIPYNADPDVLEKILDDLKNTGSEGVNIKTLWQNIDEVKNPNRSYTLTLARYLKLVDSDGTKVWLTKLGNQIRFYSGDKRKGVLIENMPTTYITMCKWIKHSSGEIMLNDLKSKYVQVFPNMKSNIVFDRAIASFLNYCKHIGLLTYYGKGSTAKITLTDFGKRTLDQPIGDAQENNPKENKDTPPVKSDEKEKLQLSDSATYPIIIKTTDRDFNWDIKSESDWAVIDSVIASIKQGWKKKQTSIETGDDK